MAEILDSETVTVVQTSTLILDTMANGRRLIRRDANVVASEENSEFITLFTWALNIRAAHPQGARCAMIGGGFCWLPRFFDANYTFDIYELEPSLSRFADEATAMTGVGTHFVPGDWQTTFPYNDLPYDFIVWDLGGDAPASLNDHLNPGGSTLSQAILELPQSTPPPPPPSPPPKT